MRVPVASNVKTLWRHQSRNRQKRRRGFLLTCSDTSRIGSSFRPTLTLVVLKISIHLSGKAQVEDLEMAQKNSNFHDLSNGDIACFWAGMPVALDSGSTSGTLNNSLGLIEFVSIVLPLTKAHIGASRKSFQKNLSLWRTKEKFVIMELPHWHHLSSPLAAKTTTIPCWNNISDAGGQNGLWVSWWIML